jgi:hypothetical protein
MSIRAATPTGICVSILRGTDQAVSTVVIGRTYERPASAVLAIDGQTHKPVTITTNTRLAMLLCQIARRSRTRSSNAGTKST